MTITLTRATRWRKRSRALLSAAAGLALVGVGMALPEQLDAPQPEFFAIDAVELAPGERTLLCPAAPQLTTAMGSDDVSYDLDLEPGDSMIETKTRFVVVEESSIDAYVGELGEETARRSPVVEIDGGVAPIIGRYLPGEEQTPLVAGVRLGHAETGDLRGLAAGGCVHPSASTWLVGGDTEVGSSTQLVLTNPSEVAARVRVEGWTSLGAMPELVELLEPGASKVVLTETMQRADRVAFHVAAEGGQVGAHLTTSTLQGIVPAGVSYVGPAAAPGIETFVGPLHLEEFDDDGWQTALRILNPGEEPASISVSLLGPEGEEPLAGAQDLTVDPGVVSELPIAAPAAGQYTVKIASDVPVTGAARTIAAGEYSEDLDGRPEDLSWLPSGNLTDDSVLLVAPDAMIAVANPTPESAEVSVAQVDSQGEVLSERGLSLGAGQTREVEVAPEAVAVRISGGVFVASAQYRVELDSGSLIAAVPGAGGGGSIRSVNVVVTN